MLRDFPYSNMPSQPAKSIAMRPSSQSIDSEAPSFMGKSLANLPSELLAQVVAHIETARILLHLSLTCRRLRRFVERDGFRVFVQTRFPYIQSSYSLHGSSFWRDAAHGLTTLQRNWDRKAFIARRIKHDPETHYDRPGQRTHRRSRQTMGFIPVIDSYETWYGGDWDSRKEVVAWGAGAGLVMRVTTMGNKAEDMWGTGTDTRKLPRCLDVHGHNIDWTVYNETNVRDGRDDITYLNLLPQQILGDPEQVIIGRASGGLSRVSLSPNLSIDQAEVVASYETGCRSVRSAARNASNQRLLAACLSDSAIALYPLDTPHRQVKPVGEVSAVPAKASERTWSSHFLNHNRLAVGFGPSEKPIQVYDIGCGQLTDKNVRSLALSDTEAGASIDGPDMVHLLATSVYSLAPIPTCSLAGGGDGEVFLSGAYDGLTRYVLYHDLKPRS